MKTLKYGLVAAVVVGLTACPEDRADWDPTTDPAAEPAVTPEAPPPAAAQEATLEDLAGLGITGQVMATARQNETEIVLTLQNAPADESLGGRIQSGTCESPGPVLARLDAIRTDEAGRAQSRSTVGHAPHLILDGNHIATVYASGTEPEADMPIACATLPAIGQAGMQPGPQPQY